MKRLSVIALPRDTVVVGVVAVVVVLVVVVLVLVALVVLVVNVRVVVVLVVVALVTVVVEDAATKMSFFQRNLVLDTEPFCWFDRFSKSLCQVT